MIACARLPAGVRSFVAAGCLAFALGGLVSAPAGAQAQASTAAPEETVNAYRRSLEAMKPQDSAALFAADAEIFEGGSAEGRPDNYFAHHLVPEFAQFEAFRLSDVSQKVGRSGDVAWVSETYGYSVTLKKGGKPIEGKGVSTYILRRIEGAWRIQMLHVSSRRRAEPH